MHRILVNTVVIDAPTVVHDRTRDFWTTALAAHPHRMVARPEYHDLDQPASPTRVIVQNIGTAAPRVHIDIQTDNVLAEVARLTKAGATEVKRTEHPPTRINPPAGPLWVVMRDPAGLLFCIVSREGEPRSEDGDPAAQLRAALHADFAAGAFTVED